ncbi:hypothetical protein [Bacillus bombysepticus]|uniref:hypothetical protein n=1 Tax=Bacillus bombysepticus TaxID=658666 RepID=UPI00301B36EE
MKIPKFVMDHYRYEDNFEAIKQDIRDNRELDGIWYYNVVFAVDALSDMKTLGLSLEHFMALVKQFESWDSKDKEEVLINKYEGIMTDKDKAIEALLEYYNAIYEKFMRRAKIEG